MTTNSDTPQQTETAASATESATDAEAIAHTGEVQPTAKKKKKKKNKPAKTEAVTSDTGQHAATPQSVGTSSLRSQLTDYSNPRRHPVIVGLVVVLIAALAGVAVLATLFASRADDLDSARNLNADKQTAEKTAGDYAVGAATFKFDDLDPWSAALKKGTAPELSSRFDVAVKTLSPLIQQVQWVQTARLIAAKTIDVRGDRQFVVQVFVSTHMTSTQNPNGLNTVTPYTITLDRSENWIITDVAGIDGAPQDGSAGSGLTSPTTATNGAPSGTDTPAPPAPAGATPAP